MINGGLNYRSDIAPMNFESKYSQMETANSRIANANRIAQVLNGKIDSDVYSAQRSVKRSGFATKSKFNISKVFKGETGDSVKSKFNSSYGVIISKANGLQTHTYISGNNDNTLGVVDQASSGFYVSTDSRKTRSRGATKVNEYVSQTKSHSTLDAPASKIFGSNVGVGPSGNFTSSKLGFKSNHLSDGGNDGTFKSSITH
jgi:hypothetical protein